MARLTSEITFEGTLGRLSAYRMRGVDGIILRQKGGPSKKRVKEDPAFENTRRINKEFDGRSKVSKSIRYVLRPLKPLADYNYAGTLTGMMTHIQKLDPESVWGQRDVALSRNPKILEGFSLNRKVTFDTIVRGMLACTLSKETCTATVTVPALVPGINFKPPVQHALYNIQAVLGIIPDLAYEDPGYTAKHADYTRIRPVIAETPWHSTRLKSEAATLELMLPQLPAHGAFTLLLAVGVAFGMPIGSTVEQTRYAGAAKVMQVE